MISTKSQTLKLLGIGMLLVLVSESVLARKETLTSRVIQTELSQANKSRAALTTLVSSIESAFTVKLPPQAAQSAAALSIVAKGNKSAGVRQDYASGPNDLSTFALKVMTAQKEGNQAAGLPEGMNLQQAQNVVTGLVTALLLLETQQVPSCAIGPIRVGEVNVQGCVTERQDAMALKAHLAQQGIAETDLEVYTKARRLMVAMIAGAGLKEYQASQTHQPGVESAYAQLWETFINKVNGQGALVKPVVAFLEAFEEVQQSVTAKDEKHPLAGILGSDDSSINLSAALDSFFNACAPPMGI